jgi:hypothetical protein
MCSTTLAIIMLGAMLGGGDEPHKETIAQIAALRKRRADQRAVAPCSHASSPRHES